jgi:prepilin-type N-terminal cleavage/methylation domain-containing protein
MSPHRIEPPQRGRAFTLVELLVSMAVLVILVTLVLALFNSATMTAGMSSKHIDADEAARMVFDRMASDFARMVRRTDVNYIFCKNGSSSTTGSNDAMFFYSEGPGFLDPAATLSNSGSAGTVSLVGYRINSNNPYHPNTPVLERLGENLTWGGLPDSTGTNPGGMVFLPLTLAGNWSATLGTPPYLSQNTEHYQVLSDKVFRMEFCFLLKGGTYALSGTTVVTPVTGYSNAPTATGTGVPQPLVTANYFTGATPPDLAGNVSGFPPDLAGIVVTIAVLDHASSRMITGSGLANLGSALADSLAGSQTVGNVQVSPPAQLTSQLWQNKLLQPGFAQSVNVPQPALAQVRIYERTFYFNAN